MRARHRMWPHRVAMLAAGLAALALLAACGSGGPHAPAEPGPSVGQRVNATLPAVVRDSVLVSASGQRVDLASFAGKVVVISDMMTLCQETCPLDTANVVAAGRAVERAGLSNRVEFLSISIDPTRDTPQRLTAYRRLFAPAPADWLTLTGTRATLTTMWKDLGVWIQKVPDTPPAPRDWLTGKPLTYDLNHSDEVFFLDPHGHERFLLEGAPHLAAGARIPPTILKFMDAAGHRNIADPASTAWTLPQALQVIAWLTKHPIPQASTTATTGTTTSSNSPAAGSGGAAVSTTARTASPAAGYHTRAVTLAGHIPGCTPERLTPTAAGQRLHLTGTTPAASAASAAACVLRGHSVIILTFSDPGNQARADARLRTHVAYYATGPGWTAVPANTGVAVAQQSAVQDVAIALHGTIGTRTG